MPEFSCADYTFPLLNRRQSLKLLQILGFGWVDIGLFERNPSYLPTALVDAPSSFTNAVREDLASSQLHVSDVFLQIGKEPAEFSVNDPDPAVRAHNREIFRRALDFCLALECSHLTGLPGVVHGDGHPDFELAKEEAAWRVALASEAGMTYAVEAHIGSICPDTTSTKRLLAAVQGLTLTLDYGHFICQGEKSDAVHALLPFASHLHLRGGAEGRLQTSVAENAIDFAGMMTRLSRMNHTGKLALEYVWVDWEGCNRTDNVSETLLLREQLRTIAAELDWPA
jgi:sugar phosphate isomerase/epimerase